MSIGNALSLEDAIKQAFLARGWLSPEDKDIAVGGIRGMSEQIDALKSEVANLEMDRDFWRDRAQCGGSDEARALLAYLAGVNPIDSLPDFFKLSQAYRDSIAKLEKKILD